MIRLVIGVDPGAAVVALAALLCAPGLRPRHVFAATLEVGKLGQAVRGGKRPRLVDDEAIRAVLLGAQAAIGEARRGVHQPHVVHVALERVTQVAGVSRMGAAYAQGLVLSQWIGGELAGLARLTGGRVETVAATEWRRALTGKPTPTDHEIGRLIPLAIQDWPARSNEHQRDAAGVALYAAQRTA